METSSIKEAHGKTLLIPGMYGHRRSHRFSNRLADRFHVVGASLQHKKAQASTGNVRAAKDVDQVVTEKEKRLAALEYDQERKEEQLRQIQEQLHVLAEKKRRRRERDLYRAQRKIDHFAAITIQRWFRAIHQRVCEGAARVLIDALKASLTQERMHGLLDARAIIQETVWACAQRRIVHRTARRMLSERLMTRTMGLACYRATTAIVAQRDSAATRAQSVWRGSVARREYTAQQRAGSVLVTTVKGWLQHRREMHERDAAMAAALEAAKAAAEAEAAAEADDISQASSAVTSSRFSAGDSRGPRGASLGDESSSLSLSQHSRQQKRPARPKSANHAMGRRRPQSGKRNSQDKGEMPARVVIRSCRPTSAPGNRAGSNSKPADDEGDGSERQHADDAQRVAELRKLTDEELAALRRQNIADKHQRWLMEREVERRRRRKNIELEKQARAEEEERLAKAAKAREQWRMAQLWAVKQREQERLQRARELARQRALREQAAKKQAAIAEREQQRLEMERQAMIAEDDLARKIKRIQKLEAAKARRQQMEQAARRAQAQQEENRLADLRAAQEKGQKAAQARLARINAERQKAKQAKEQEAQEKQKAQERIERRASLNLQRSLQQQQGHGTNDSPAATAATAGAATFTTTMVSVSAAQDQSRNQCRVPAPPTLEEEEGITARMLDEAQAPEMAAAPAPPAEQEGGESRSDPIREVQQHIERLGYLQQEDSDEGEPGDTHRRGSGGGFGKRGRRRSRASRKSSASAAGTAYARTDQTVTSTGERRRSSHSSTTGSGATGSVQFVMPASVAPSAQQQQHIPVDQRCLGSRKPRSRLSGKASEAGDGPLRQLSGANGSIMSVAAASAAIGTTGMMMAGPGGAPPASTTSTTSPHASIWDAQPPKLEQFTLPSLTRQRGRGRRRQLQHVHQPTLPGNASAPAPAYAPAPAPAPAPTPTAAPAPAPVPPPAVMSFNAKNPFSAHHHQSGRVSKGSTGGTSSSGGAMSDEHAGVFDSDTENALRSIEALSRDSDGRVEVSFEFDVLNDGSDWLGGDLSELSLLQTKPPVGARNPPVRHDHSNNFPALA